MRPGDRGLIPAETVAVVRTACPKGTRVTRVRDVLGPIFEDEPFAEWFAAEGQGVVAPGLVALVCVLQSMESLTDREAADAVRTRMDWKYALGLELTDPGFAFSVLSGVLARIRTLNRLEKVGEPAPGVGGDRPDGAGLVDVADPGALRGLVHPPDRVRSSARGGGGPGGVG